MNNLYTNEFYDGQSLSSFESAKKIFSFLFEFYSPGSVIDMGCGVGSWLAAAEYYGINQLVGVDGDWVDETKFLSKKARFFPTDLSEPFVLNQKFDMAISVEVAEHLSETRADSFVEDLCHLSSVVLFSAAIPEQGGVNHINEQFQSYWVEKFEARGYECFDIIRPAIWNMMGIEYWYAQNILFFVDKGFDGIDKNVLNDKVKPIYDAVHPVLFKSIGRVPSKPSLRFCLSALKRFFLG